MKKVRLQDVTLSITDGKHGDCDSAENSGYFFISCKDVHDGIIDYSNARQITERAFMEAHKRTMLEPNDILVTNSGTIGRMALVKDIPETYKTTFQKSVAIVKPDTKVVLPSYLYYKLQNCVTDFINRSNGSAQKNLLLGTMRDFEIDLHESFDDQMRLAVILGAYDDLIENNQKQIKLLEEAAQRLYKEWFIDLRFPGYETTPVHDGVPEGWEKYPFSQKVSVMSGGTPKTEVKEYYGGSIPFFSPKDYAGSFFAFKTATTISDVGLANCNSPLYPENTIIITARGTVGKTVILAVPMAMNQSCYALKCDELNLPYYLFFALNAEVQKLKTMSNGGVFDTIIVKTFDNIEISFPANNLAASFEKTVSPIMEQIKTKMLENMTLTEARDRLLPKLMSGEIEV